MPKIRDEYDVGAAFAAIENELMSSMVRNMERHKVEEIGEEKEWEMWQALQLKSLDKYKRQNKEKYGTQFQDINKRIGNILIRMNEDGQMDQERKILKAIKNGADLTKASDAMSGRFFEINDRKMDALIKATTGEIRKAETAVLRKADDVYRKTIFNAQVYANSGAGTYEKAVDMATKDFLAAGLNCVEYKNGARHTLSDYADMAVRTAAKRAYLQGEGTKRQEWGIHTVIVNQRSDTGPGGVCPECLPFVGKVFIDDVWSGGKEGEKDEDGEELPLLSDAIGAGLYHPRCRDSHTTYFPGISTPPSGKITKKDVQEAVETEKEEAKQQYAERQAEKYERLAETRLDPENKQKYEARADEWEAEAIFKNDYVTRARKIKNEDDLLKVSNSSIIKMESIEEIGEYFAKTHNISVKGFDKKDLFDVKTVLAGYDDFLTEFSSFSPRIHTIEYNPRLKVYGKMSPSGLSLVGPLGLGDYGTGIHEATHALDFAMSKPTTHSFAENIINNARKNLKLRKNSKEYLNLRVRMCGGLQDIDKEYELLAYGIETAKAGPTNKLADEIYRQLKGE